MTTEIPGSNAVRYMRMKSQLCNLCFPITTTQGERLADPVGHGFENKNGRKYMGIAQGSRYLVILTMIYDMWNVFQDEYNVWIHRSNDKQTQCSHGSISPLICYLLFSFLQLPANVKKIFYQQYQRLSGDDHEKWEEKDADWMCAKDNDERVRKDGERNGTWARVELMFGGRECLMYMYVWWWHATNERNAPIGILVWLHGPTNDIDRNQEISSGFQSELRTKNE